MPPVGGSGAAKPPDVQNRPPTLLGRSSSVNHSGRACPVRRPRNNESEMLATFLSVSLGTALFVTLPVWPHSRRWGYYPSAALAVLVVISWALLSGHGARV